MPYDDEDDRASLRKDIEKMLEEILKGEPGEDYALLEESDFFFPSNYKDVYGRLPPNEKFYPTSPLKGETDRIERRNQKLLQQEKEYQSRSANITMLLKYPSKSRRFEIDRCWAAHFKSDLLDQTGRSLTEKQETELCSGILNVKPGLSTRCLSQLFGVSRNTTKKWAGWVKRHIRVRYDLYLQVFPEEKKAGSDGKIDPWKKEEYRVWAEKQARHE